MPILFANLTSLVWALAVLLLLLVASFYAFPRLMIRASIRVLATVVLNFFYHIQVIDEDNIPKEKGCLLVANHLSWLDGILMIYLSRRLVRTLVYSGNFRNSIMKTMAKHWDQILIGPGPKSIARALKTARTAISSGEIVGIFPEGGISRSGNLQTFRPGVLKVLKGTGAPVIPMYFDGVWGSIFSFEGGKFFWKIPKCWRFPIRVYYGEPIYNAENDVFRIRQAVQQLGAKAVADRMNNAKPVQQSVIEECKRRKFKSKIADSMGAELTGGSLLMRSLILRRLLKRRVFQEGETHVGILLPPTVPAVVVNLAVSLDKRVAVNLNYTVSEEVMNNCIQRSGIRHVLTSQKFLDKLELKPDADVILLDDLKEEVSTTDKITSLLQAYACPSKILASILGLTDIQASDVVTVIFTSGSTGIPKGVMLTQSNLAHNVDAINTVIRLTPDDAIVGILPFFHSFGYTVTLWAVCGLNIRGLYHFNPLDAKQVGKLVQKHQGTILLSTPTFLRGFLRRCSKEEFTTVDTVVAGAEKLPKELVDAFENKFDVRPVEGYGTTELSPLVSVNVPPSRSTESHQIDLRDGTVGRPLPGVSAKVVNLDTHEECGVDESGMLMIKGANVMKGYMDMPEKTAEVIQDGWYVTGDIAKIDEDGFITITGRESRFSKIGGEMVPHIKVEETLLEVLGVDDDEGPQIAVTAVPDQKKGERLVVLHETMSESPENLCSQLRERGLPNIFIPSVDSFFQVDHVPVLGTGKLDLQAIKTLASELTKA